MQDAGDDLPVVLPLASGLIPGMNGSITAHRSSESQNRSAIATSRPQNGCLGSQNDKSCNSLVRFTLWNQPRIAASRSPYSEAKTLRQYGAGGSRKGAYAQRRANQTYHLSRKLVRLILAIDSRSTACTNHRKNQNRVRSMLSNSAS